MNDMKVFEWLRDDLLSYVNSRKWLTYSQIALIMKSLREMEQDLKRVSNLIQRINDYSVENKHVWYSIYTQCYNV